MARLPTCMEKKVLHFSGLLIEAECVEREAETFHGTEINNIVW